MYIGIGGYLIFSKISHENEIIWSLFKNGWQGEDPLNPSGSSTGSL